MGSEFRLSIEGWQFEKQGLENEDWRMRTGE